MPSPDRGRRVSKYLALRLRHRPDEIGLRLDREGWASVDELLAGAAAHGFPIDRDELQRVVADNDKQRYELDVTGTRIRARQGHSVAVDLGLGAASPPELLFHGTVERFVDAILAEGLRPMGRQHVHLSPDAEAASAVGSRRGKPVILEIRAAEMERDGHQLWLSGNGVWLALAVPPAYISRLAG